MDYPQLNLFFGLGLILAIVVSIGLRVLLSKVHLPVWMSFLSWVTLGLGLLAAFYIEILFLRLMTPAFNRQIAIGVLIIGGIGALITALLYRRGVSPRAGSFIFVVQVLFSLISIGLAIGLYRSLVPV